MVKVDVLEKLRNGFLHRDSEFHRSLHFTRTMANRIILPVRRRVNGVLVRALAREIIE